MGAGAVLGKVAGGVHLPAWDDLQLSNITSNFTVIENLMNHLQCFLSRLHYVIA